MKRRYIILDIEKKMHFSYDLENTLTDEERLADVILSKMRDTLKSDEYNIIIHDYFENKVVEILNHF